MHRKIGSWILSSLVIVVLTLGGCTLQAATDNASDAPASSPVVQAQPEIDLPKLNGSATVVMVVKGEPITIEVDGSKAPITAGNFVDLVDRGTYDDLMFHRVVRDPEPFVVQGGDPNSKDPNTPTSRLGTGGFVDPETGSPRNIPLEITPEGEETPIYGQTFQSARVNAQPELSHTRGAVAMARSNMPDSASSQFYFALTDLPFLDGSYAVFGYVTDGMDVVDQIQQGDRIETATVIQGLENLER
ncbi:MAG: peptidylprolyl isomerase [Cyanobacteriota bacterium]|nr:peptidylprolyl isomerase [Cyanobacteriota bacterium]